MHREWTLGSSLLDLQAVSLLVLTDCPLTWKSSQDKWKTQLVNNLYGVIPFLAGRKLSLSK